MRDETGILRFPNLPFAEDHLLWRSKNGTSAWCLVKVPDAKTPFYGLRYVDLKAGGLRKLIDKQEKPLIHVFYMGKRVSLNKSMAPDV